MVRTGARRSGASLPTHTMIARSGGNGFHRTVHIRTRRDFLSLAGKGFGLAALSSATVASLLKNVEAATKTIAHLTPEEAAMDEDYWFAIQNAFTVTRG